MNIFLKKNLKFSSTILIISIIGIIPTFPSIFADYFELIDKHEIETQCRSGQVLVYRTISNDYVCTAKSTAVTWVHRDMALLVDENTKELVGIVDEPEQIDMIECRENLQLIFKVSDNSPACVTSDTFQKLIKRGWISNQFENSI